MRKRRYIAFRHKRTGLYLFPSKRRVYPDMEVDEEMTETLVGRGYARNEAELLSMILNVPLTTLEINNMDDIEGEIEEIAGGYPLWLLVSLDEFDREDHTRRVLFSQRKEEELW